MASVNSYTGTFQRFQRGYHALFALLEDYPENLYEQVGVLDNWSPHQLLAHLTGWLVEVEHQFSMITLESDNAASSMLGSRINTQAIETRADQSWLDTTTELRDVFMRFERKASGLSPNLAAADSRYETLIDGAWEECINQIGHLIRFVAQPQ